MLIPEEIDYYEFGPFRLDPVSRHLLRAGEVVSLQPKTFDILLLLVQNSGRIVTKEMLMSQIWSEQFVEENNLTVRMSYLRKILDEKPGNNRYIETTSGRGYRFVAKVRRERNNVIENIDDRFRSLAVLPFVNESKNPDLDYLSDGLTESLINTLSQLPRVKVIARSSVFQYKNREINLQSVSQELGVQVVLLGRVYKINDNLLISLELVNLKDRSQIWGAKYNYPLMDVFKLEQEITKEVSANLKLKLTADEKENLYKRYTENWEAYILYLKGRYFWNKRTLDGINTAVNFFQRAIEKDPQYALAYSGLADCYMILFSFSFLPPEEAVPKAEAAVIKALELDDLLAEAHTSLAYIRFLPGKNWLEAEKEFKRSIELNSNYAQAHYWYASYLACLGRFDEAFRELNKAQQIDPLSMTINKAICKTLYLSRNYDEAIRKCLEALEMDASYGHIRAILGLAYLEKKMYQEAIQEFEKVLRFSAGDYKLSDKGKQSFLRTQKKVFALEANPELIGVLGYTYAITGKRSEALELLEGLKDLSKQRYVEPHCIALIYVGLGDKNRAIEWLEKIQAGPSNTLFFLKVWAIFDSLRSEPRFEDLLKRIGFPP